MHGNSILRPWSQSVTLTDTRVAIVVDCEVNLIVIGVHHDERYALVGLHESNRIELGQPFKLGLHDSALSRLLLYHFLHSCFIPGTPASTAVMPSHCR